MVTGIVIIYYLQEGDLEIGQTYNFPVAEIR